MQARSPVDVVRRRSAFRYDWIGGSSPRKNRWKLRDRVDQQRQWAIQSEGKVRMAETTRACTQEAQKGMKDMKVLMK